MSVVEFAKHPVELKSALLLKFFRRPLFGVGSGEVEGVSLKRCYELLDMTSRSFAAVIRELHPELRNAVMLFYLILRALDTIEDDMSIEQEEKIKLLKGFSEHLESTDWSFNGNDASVKDRVVLVDFPVILKEFKKLKPEYQQVIKKITMQMGFGMAAYVDVHGLNTIEEYEKYCYYVAGLVGEGLTQLFVLANFASFKLSEKSSEDLFLGMGWFLQKTNIIRDYSEDLDDGRLFWPKDIWSNYGTSLADFKKPQFQEAGVHCINHLVLDALKHVEKVLDYLSNIHEQSTFQFCAIPQVMAIATLALVFNNPQVLHRNVKIRKGTTCYLLLKSRTFKGCIEIFQYYLRDIKARLPVQDPNYLKINNQIAKIEQAIEEMYQENLPEGVKPRETTRYLKVKERTSWDAKIVPIEKEENDKFRMVMTSLLTILLSIAIVVSNAR